MEQSINQVVKWGVAGWFYVLQVAAYLFGLKLLLGDATNPFQLLAGQFATTPDPGIVLAILATAGIPLGFLIYEVYYFFFWGAPIRKGHDPAEAKLISRLRTCTDHEIMDPDLLEVQESWIRLIAENGKGKLKPLFWILEKRSGRDPRDLMRFRNEWSLVRTVWLRSLARARTDNVGYMRAADRFEYLSAMFDGLGVIQMAVWLAVATLGGFLLWRWLIDFGGSEVLMHWHSVPLWIVFLGVFAVAVAVALVTSWIIGVNRILARSSILVLANSFICHFECTESEGPDRACHLKSADLTEQLAASEN